MHPPRDGAVCWACGSAVPGRRIDVETVIRGRPASEGGPYRMFRCPACQAENGVLAGPRGGRMLYPLSGLDEPKLVDHLLSGAERSRLAKARAWWTAHRASVERFRRGLDEPDGPTRRAPPRPAPSVPPPRVPPGPASRPPRVRTAARSGPRSVLGVPDDATLDEVRRAFRRLAKRVHPDRAADPAAAAARFRDVRAAYEELLRELGA